MALGHNHPPIAGGSLLALLHPRGQTRLFAGVLAVGLPAAWLSVTQLSLPLWGVAASIVGLLAYPAVRKWRQDRQRLGTPAMVLSILLVTQSLHTVYRAPACKVALSHPDLTAETAKIAERVFHASAIPARSGA